METTEEERFVVVDDEPRHWFCHKCHTHFELPMKEKTDENGIWLCPSCCEPTIEEFKEDG